MNRRAFLKLLPFVPFAAKAALAAAKPAAPSIRFLPIDENGMPGEWRPLNSFQAEIMDKVDRARIDATTLGAPWTREEMTEALKSNNFTHTEGRPRMYRTQLLSDPHAMLEDLSEQASFDTYWYKRRT